MKTLSSYILKESNANGQSSPLNEAAGMTSLASYDSDKIWKLPQFPKSEKDAIKFAPAGYKTFQKKLNAIGCTAIMAYIEMYEHQGRIGATACLDISSPRSSKSNFWLRVNEKVCLFGLKEDFLKMSMYAQVQPDLIGKDLDEAVDEIKKVRDFVQWYNAQDPAKLFPVFLSRA